MRHAAGPRDGETGVESGMERVALAGNLPSLCSHINARGFWGSSQCPRIDSIAKMVLRVIEVWLPIRLVQKVKPRITSIPAFNLRPEFIEGTEFGVAAEINVEVLVGHGERVIDGADFFNTFPQL
jgi:hypothetical protein